MAETRKAKYFSGLGDEGETGLLGDGRYKKSDLRFEVLGTIDELSSIIGMVKADLTDSPIIEDLSNIQRGLYRIMTELAYLDQQKIKTPSISTENISQLENRIDEVGNSVPIPTGFILPGDSSKAAQVDLARSVTRRMERRVCEFDRETGVDSKNILKYMNRLSTYFYILELKILQDQGITSPTLAKNNPAQNL